MKNKKFIFPMSLYHALLLPMEVLTQHYSGKTRRTPNVCCRPEWDRYGRPLLADSVEKVGLPKALEY